MKKLLVKVVLGFILVYAVVGFFVLPGIVKTQIEENGSSILKRKVMVDNLSINPFSFYVGIENFRISGKEDEKNLLLIRKISLDIDPSYLLKGEVNIALLQLSAPSINLDKKADGNFNFQDLLSLGENDKKVETASAPTAIPNILVQKFNIERGKVHFSDESRGKVFKVDLEPINFSIHDFSTRKDHNNALSLYIEIDDGAYVKYKGKVNSLEPLQLEGALKLHSGRLYTQWKYFEERLGFIVADGTLDAEMAYTADLSTTPMQININQYQLDIKDLRLEDKQTKEDMLKLPYLALNGDADLTNEQVNVENFDIKGLFLKAVRNKEGEINWLSYLPQSKETAETNASQEPSGWKVDVKNVRLNTEQVSFEEHYAKQPYRAGFKDFDLSLKEIHMDDKALDINSYDLQIQDTYLDEIDGIKAFMMPTLSLKGEAKIKAQELVISTFLLKDIKLKALKDKSGVLNFEKYAPFASTSKKAEEDKPSDPWKIDLGHMQVSTQNLEFKDLSAKEPFHVNIKDFELNLSRLNLENNMLSLNAFDTELTQLYLRPLNAKTKWTGFNKLKLNGHINRAENLDVVVEEIGLDGLFAYALMDEKGELNFARLSPKVKASPKKAIKEEPSTLKWKVENIDINNAKVFYTDRLNAKDGLVKVEKINLNLKNIDSSGKVWTKSKLSFNINKTGKVNINTKLRQKPLKVYSKVHLKGLELKSFQAFVDKKANVDVNSGVLNFEINAEHNKKKSVVLANTQINDVNLSERKEGKSFFAFKKLVVKKIDLRLNPDQMKIDRIDIYQPYARMKIDENQSTNLDKLMVQETNTTQERIEIAEKEPKKKPFSVFIGKVNFKDGTGSFTDLSLPLPFSTDIHTLNGQMLALGTLEDITTTTDIDGVVDEYGLMNIKGSLLSANPKKFTDMSVKFQNIDMTNLSPYTGKFIGYELKEGKMNVELDYKINDSNMQGGNRIILKKLTLGEEIESEDAISAPVSLAIALLKDSDGVIDLDVPVKGNVDEPEFEVGHVVWTAFKNMIVGVATAPFRFLGNMLGMDEDELDNVGFKEGEYALLPPEKEKLDKLSTALIDKEMLTLQVAGTYDKKRDLFAMQVASVYKEAIAKLDDNTTDISKMDREELDDLLKEVYVTHFKEEKLDALKDKINKLEIDSDTKALAIREEMKLDLTLDQKIGKQELVSLADKRAKVILHYLESKNIQAERLSQLESFDIELSKEENEYIPSKLELGAK